MGRRLNKEERRERFAAVYTSILHAIEQLEGAARLARSVRLKYAHNEIEAARFQIETLVRTCGRAGHWDEVPFTPESLKKLRRAWKKATRLPRVLE